MYEFWQGGNHHGLVQKPSSGNEASRFDSRPIPPHRTRSTELGTLLIFDDFDEYKAKLHETRDMEPNTDPTSPVQRETKEVPADVRARFERTGQIPDTCVDWEQLGAGVLRS